MFKKKKKIHLVFLYFLFSSCFCVFVFFVCFCVFVFFCVFRVFLTDFFVCVFFNVLCVCFVFFVLCCLRRAGNAVGVSDISVPCSVCICVCMFAVIFGGNPG